MTLTPSALMVHIVTDGKDRENIILLNVRSTTADISGSSHEKKPNASHRFCYQLFIFSLVIDKHVVSHISLTELGLWIRIRILRACL